MQEKRAEMDKRLSSEAISVLEVPVHDQHSTYPEPFASMIKGRTKRRLGDFFNLSNFGVNLTHLEPGAISALRHSHSKQDEFIYILEGNPTLHTDDGKSKLTPGMCAGFMAGSGNGHQLINESDKEVIYLEIGDRTPGDTGSYPDDDLQAAMTESGWQFSHKDGTPY